MSFWNTSDGADVTDDVEKEYEAGGHSHVPDDTNCLALLHGAAWKDDKDGNSFINVRWDILQHDAYKGIVVFQKLWVEDDDPQARDPAKKRDNALRMLAAIDANAGGKLARKGKKPTDDDLAVALTNKQMMIKCKVWKKDDGSVGGNWIAAVGPKGGSMSVTAPKDEPKKAARKPSPVDDEDLDDDVPF